MVEYYRYFEIAVWWNLLLEVKTKYKFIWNQDIRYWSHFLSNWVFDI